MEPPAKRMRIWQSVEVDEENVEYIKAKQKQQQKFKGRLESIFEKYGNMHESMSDEIDMATNRVVVDRGHLRRLKRQVGRKETMLLDTLGLAVEKEPEHGSEDEENAEDSEDELAPTQPGKSNGGQPELDGQRPRASDNDVQSPRSDNTSSSIPQQTNTLATATPHFGPMQTPNTPNPAPNLLPLVQFPQTPAGQQAQTTFYMTLTQGIGELVQKAMAQSGLLPPNFSTPFANAAPLPTTPITTADKIAPATDPKWFFPPLSAASRQNPVAQSSPLPAHVVAPPTEQVDQSIGATLPHELEGQVLAESIPLADEASPLVSHTMLQESSPTRCRRTSPRVEIQRRRIRSARKYPFNPEDDAYISRKKMVDQLSWAAIKESQEKWKDWPVSVLSRRWAAIRDQNLHLQTPLLTRSSDGAHGLDHESDEQVQAPLTRSHHLPTPSSSEHEDGQKEVVEPTETANEFPSSAYFDDDERELLSLAGTDVDEDRHLSSDEEAPDPVSEDSIIPSIETTDLPTIETTGFIDEDDLQRELLGNLPMQDVTTPTRQASVQVKMEPASPSPIITQNEDPLTRRFETVPDSDPREDTNDMMQQADTTSPLLCPICDRSFKTSQALARHQANPRNTHTHPGPPRRRSVSLDLIADSGAAADEDDLILATTPPPIKREPSTPSTSFFVSAFQTPKTAHHRGSSCASGSLSTSKTDRKAHVKQLKQCWKGSATPLAPASAVAVAVAAAKAKRKSLGSMPSRKRMRMQDSEDRDELCI